jgi:hypothetical protein
MAARRLKAVDPSEEEDPEILEDTINDLGQRVCKYKSGKLNIKVTFRNSPSPEAIKETIQAYNELFHKFNPPQNP